MSSCVYIHAAGIEKASHITTLQEYKPDLFPHEARGSTRPEATCIRYGLTKDHSRSANIFAHHARKS